MRSSIRETLTNSFLAQLIGSDFLVDNERRNSADLAFFAIISLSLAVSTRLDGNRSMALRIGCAEKNTRVKPRRYDRVRVASQLLSVTLTPKKAYACTAETRTIEVRPMRLKILIHTRLTDAGSFSYTA